MRILCVADHVDPLVYSANAKERFRDIDLVLSAGDIPMQYLGFIASTINRQVLFVFGNHNLKHLGIFKTNRRSALLADNLGANGLTMNYFGSTYIGEKVIKTKNDLLIAGLGGCISYNKGENQFTEFQMFLKILFLIPRLFFNRIIHGRYLDILLTHSPPYQLNDRTDPAHKGFKAFRFFMRAFEPRYLLHGHVHLYDYNEERITHFHKTKIINVYDHYVLELGNE